MVATLICIENQFHRVILWIESLIENEQYSGMLSPGARALLDVGISYIGNRWSELSLSDQNTVTETLTDVLATKMDIETGSNIINKIVGSPQPMMKSGSRM